MKKISLLLTLLVLFPSMYASTWYWTAQSGDLGSSGSINSNPTLYNQIWNLTVSDPTYVGFSNGYIQLGSKNNPTNLQLSTTAFSNCVVNSITVDAYSYGGNHTYSISVGSSTAQTGQTQSAASNPISCNFSESGQVLISFFAGAEARALYIKKITINYTGTYDGGTPGSTTDTIPGGGTPGTTTDTTIVQSGTYSVVSWTLDNYGTLRLSGKGAMANPTFYDSDIPWYKYRKQVKTIIVNSGITQLCESAFRDCYNATSVFIPKSVRKFCSRAFWNCTKLSAINYDGTINDWAAIDFQVIYGSDNTIQFSCNPIMYAHGLTINGSKQTTIDLREFSGNLKEQSFEFYKDATSIIIGENVSSIYSTTFYECTNVTDVYCYAQMPPVCNGDWINNASDAFAAMPQFTTTLHVPAGTTAMYKIAVGWSRFYNIVEDITAASIDNCPSSKNNNTKVIRDGQVLIQRGDRLYDTTGRMVEK